MGDKKKHQINILVLLLVSGIFLFILSYRANERVVLVQGLNESKKLNLNKTYNHTLIISSCKYDSDCSWISVNCCPADSGAKWECINKNSYIDCKSKMVLCPQVISPKPKIPCKCIEGECVASKG